MHEKKFMWVMTVKQVAESLCVTPRTVRSYIKRGLIPAMKLGGRAGYRIVASDLLKAIQTHATASKILNNPELLERVKQRGDAE